MVDIRRVSKRFGQVQALEDVSFSVRPGEVFGFVGSNGAGKTTTMRIVLGVLSADAGQVLWQGRPVDADVRRRIGYMPEERGLYPKMKVGEQLTYLARLHGLPAGEARAAVERWTTLLDVGHRLGDEVQKLSLGNQQRVQLAAALVHDPEVLVLDEPFSGLDPTAVEVMSGVLRRKADAGVPVIFSSHQLELVERLCDRIGIIAGGRMVAVGSVAELRERDGAAVFEVLGPPEGWAADVPGVVAVEGTRVRLAPGADDQQVLKAALAAGPVHEFRRWRPPLTELYRDVVASGTAVPA
ncbi:ATP-binding cassette domain-containing protein [Pseudonocardia sp. KRD-184]|uniref:ATP-binding cassette domain-containing protein n=1 Tax=Pseudonocardia oceani TaxID=2792013 RepID=A0ABS6UB70_9PSEU|nr:ATP-binding cassette domain-containing protein [Pseudonocardia oceani]MBW0089508.1 ATP-binding cassette domain-containing protein [Pseudonocardia oceani]MBW0096518.1 ATP-binding cassette domain-containing protein [Pseudonocardia oceani]MBW0109238.1 ATP-binding cassette domain-containing protein [Pseudonocardia oceani]MBW0119846.1 ATP-binding cassette domain-containing protein [Pseudonocardia oceani]MBW0129409.1 ATP-binding cassette domain-containing protein [Pseudonocardia oceani]